MRLRKKKREGELDLSSAQLVLADDSLPKKFSRADADIDLDALYQLSRLGVLQKLQADEDIRRQKENREVALAKGDVVRVGDMSPSSTLGFALLALTVAAIGGFELLQTIMQWGGQTRSFGGVLFAALFTLFCSAGAVGLLGVTSINKKYRVNQKKQHDEMLPPKVSYTASAQRVGISNEIIVTRTAPSIENGKLVTTTDILRVALTAATEEAAQSQTDKVLDWCAALQKETDRKYAEFLVANNLAQLSQQIEAYALLRAQVETEELPARQLTVVNDSIKASLDALALEQESMTEQTQEATG